MIAADSQYEVSFRPNWGDDGPIGHVVVRRLDDRAVVAEAPVLDQYEAERLLAQAEHDYVARPQTSSDLAHRR